MSVTKKVSEKEQAFLDEEIQIEFYNIEEPGMMLKFPFGPTNNIKDYVFFHSGRYKLPRKVVEHIESQGSTINKYRPDGQGNLTPIKEGKKPRFQCRQIFS